MKNKLLTIFIDRKDKSKQKKQIKQLQNDCNTLQKSDYEILKTCLITNNFKHTIMHIVHTIHNTYNNTYYTTI